MFTYVKAFFEESPILRGIRNYNQVDCESTWKLRDWLLQRQQDNGTVYLSEPVGRERERGPVGQFLAQGLVAEDDPGDRGAEPGSGQQEFAVVAPFPQVMPTLALGGSIGTGDEGIEAEAVMVKDLAALAALPAGAVKDKIVFFSNRMARTQDGSGYSAAVPVRAQGASAAAAIGSTSSRIRSASIAATRS